MRGTEHVGGKKTRWNLLAELEAVKGRPLSGQSLGRRLGISRTAVWKHIQKLRELGYDIESVARQGYRLKGEPDLLIPERVFRTKNHPWLRRPYYHFMEIGSTNDEALRLAVEGAPHGTVVVSETQTSGRGRLDRQWMSPPGKGIYLSVVLRPTMAPREMPWVTMAAAVALVRTLRRYDLSAQVKWPNDVLVRGKKVAGILTELQTDQDRIRFLVLGVGINVNQDAAEFHGRVRYPATSIAAEKGGKISRAELLGEYLLDLEEVLVSLSEGRLDDLRREMVKISAVEGRYVEIDTSDGTIRGVARGLDRCGALKVRDTEGVEHIVWIGEIRRLRPVDVMGHGSGDHGCESAVSAKGGQR